MCNDNRLAIGLFFFVCFYVFVLCNKLYLCDSSRLVVINVLTFCLYSFKSFVHIKILILIIIIKQAASNNTSHQKFSFQNQFTLTNLYILFIILPWCHAL